MGGEALGGRMLGDGAGGLHGGAGRVLRDSGSGLVRPVESPVPECRTGGTLGRAHALGRLLRTASADERSRICFEVP